MSTWKIQLRDPTAGLTLQGCFKVNNHQNEPCKGFFIRKINFRASQLKSATLAAFSGPRSTLVAQRGEMRCDRNPDYFITGEQELHSSSPRVHSQGGSTGRLLWRALWDQEWGELAQGEENRECSQERAELPHGARPFPRVWCFGIFLQTPEFLETPRALNQTLPCSGH